MALHSRTICALEQEIADRLYAAWMVAATTGLRRGEVLGLRWEDLEGDWLSVCQTVVSVMDRPQLSTPKTNSASRSIHLASQVGRC